MENEIVTQREFLEDFKLYLEEEFNNSSIDNEIYEEEIRPELFSMIKMDIEDFMDKYLSELDIVYEFQDFEANDFLKDEIDEILREFIDKMDESFEF